MLEPTLPAIPGIFMPYVGGVSAYKEWCDGVAANVYQGFRLGTSIEGPQSAAQ
jgi:cyclohexanone monooxygenase